MTVGQNRSTARSTAQIQRASSLVPVDCPVDHPDTESKALWSGRPAGRLAPVSARRAQDCARRSTARSTEPWASRPLRSTDVHSLVHVWQTQGRVGRPVDRTREPCSLYLGGRPGRSTGSESCSLYLGGRQGGRPDFPNGHIFDRWRSTGPVDRRPVRLQISLTASFQLGL